MIHNEDIVVLYNLYATNTYRKTGSNHFVGDHMYRMIHIAMMLIIATSFYLAKVFPFGCSRAICNLLPSRPLYYGCLMYKSLF